MRSLLTGHAERDGEGHRHCREGEEWAGGKRRAADGLLSSPLASFSRQRLTAVLMPAAPAELCISRTGGAAAATAGISSAGGTRKEFGGHGEGGGAGAGACSHKPPSARLRFLLFAPISTQPQITTTGPPYCRRGYVWGGMVGSGWCWSAGGKRMRSRRRPATCNQGQSALDLAPVP